MQQPINAQVLLKAGSFTIGLMLLLAGAQFLDYPDSDVGISVLMAFTTLVTAEWSIKVIWLRRWVWLPWTLFWIWLSVDGVYWAYWSIVRPEVMIREVPMAGIVVPLRFVWRHLASPNSCGPR